MRGAEAGGGRGVPPPRRCARPRPIGGSGRRRRALGLSGRGAGTGRAGSSTGGTRRNRTERDGQGSSGRSHGSLRPAADQRLHAAGGGLGPGPAPRPSLGEAAEEGGRPAVLSRGIHPVGLPGPGPAAPSSAAAGPVRRAGGWRCAARRGGARRRGRGGGRGGQVMAGREGREGGRWRGGSPSATDVGRVTGSRPAGAPGRSEGDSGAPPHPPRTPAAHAPAPPAGGGTVTGFSFEWCGLGQGLRGVMSKNGNIRPFFKPKGWRWGGELRRSFSLAAR